MNSENNNENNQTVENLEDNSNNVVNNEVINEPVVNEPIVNESVVNNNSNNINNLNNNNKPSKKGGSNLVPLIIIGVVLILLILLGVFVFNKVKKVYVNVKDTVDEVKSVIPSSDDVKVNKNLPKGLKNAVNSSGKLVTFDYDAIITVQIAGTSYKTTQDCKQDTKKNLSYCVTNSMDIYKIEEYKDYNNKVVYTKNNSSLVNTGDSGWTKGTLNDKDSNFKTNNFFTLSNFMTDVEESEENGFKKYFGKISLSKINESLGKISNTKISDTVNVSVPIYYLVNDKNYIVKLVCSLDVAGQSENIEVNYSNFNGSNDIVIPSDALNS